MGYRIKYLMQYKDRHGKPRVYLPKAASQPKTDGYYSWTDEDMKAWLSGFIHSGRARALPTVSLTISGCGGPTFRVSAPAYLAA